MVIKTNQNLLFFYFHAFYSAIVAQMCEFQLILFSFVSCLSFLLPVLLFFFVVVKN